MMYEWVKSEEITAQKLNASQRRPMMEWIDNKGVGGGLESSSLSEEQMDCDPGTGTWHEQYGLKVTQTGAIDYSQDKSGEYPRWRMLSGAAGVNGKLYVESEEAHYLGSAYPVGPVYNWQHVETDSYGNISKVEQVLDTQQHTTTLWEPGSSTRGDLWLRKGKIAWDCEQNIPSGVDACWKYKIQNEQNDLLMPIARHNGRNNPANINLCENLDVAPRQSDARWIRTALPDVGLTTPIQSIGELGGIFAYQAVDAMGNEQGIGLASGIEFYDCKTISCRNTTNARPKSTCARIDFGSGGKHGFIAISNINPEHPWQFRLSGALDIGSGGGGDCPHIPCDFFSHYAHGPLAIGYQWDAPTSYPVCSITGFMTGDVVSMRGANVIEDYRGHTVKTNPGEVEYGRIGIATAHFEWTTMLNKADPAEGIINWNPNGGIVRGIMQDSDCRPSIDCQGFIHIPKTSAVEVTCANACAVTEINYPMYQELGNHNCSRWSCRRMGAVNGVVKTLVPLTTHDIRPKCARDAIMTDVLGEVRSGEIGISSALWQPTNVNAGGIGCLHPSTWSEYNGLPNYWTAQKQRGGGVIRGIVPDIEYTESEVDGQKWRHPILPAYIDITGVIHIPMTSFKQVEVCGMQQWEPFTITEYGQSTPPFKYPTPRYRMLEAISTSSNPGGPIYKG